MQVLVNFVNCKRVTLGRNNGNISGAELMVWVGRSKRGKCSVPTDKDSKCACGRDEKL